MGLMWWFQKLGKPFKCELGMRKSECLNELRVACYGLRVAGCVLRVAGCVLRGDKQWPIPTEYLPVMPDSIPAKDGIQDRHPGL